MQRASGGVKTKIPKTLQETSKHVSIYGEEKQHQQPFGGQH